MARPVLPFLCWNFLNLLQSWDFVVMVIASCVIASPLAFYLLHNWLHKYEYRIIFGPGVFVLSALAALVITIVTVSFQSIKAAMANPVASLRSEYQSPPGYLLLCSWVS